MLREINSHDWPDFCNRISQQRRGASVRIESILPDGKKSDRVGEAVFEGMELDANGSCNDVLHVRVRNEHEVAYDIVDPIHILLRKTKTGDDFNSIQIEGEAGTTFVTFHPAIHAEMLEGLEVT